MLRRRFRIVWLSVGLARYLTSGMAQMAGDSDRTPGLRAMPHCGGVLSGTAGVAIFSDTHKPLLVAPQVNTRYAEVPQFYGWRGSLDGRRAPCKWDNHVAPLDVLPTTTTVGAHTEEQNDQRASSCSHRSSSTIADAQQMMRVPAPS
jgi:hypothetical protein